MMTSISYNLRVGIVITYFNGNFRLFDSITYHQIWYHEEMDLKEEENREINITFVCSKLSNSHGLLAIGGLEGRVFLFDASSQTKVGVNDDVHDTEIISIYFNDKMS